MCYLEMQFGFHGHNAILSIHPISTIQHLRDAILGAHFVTEILGVMLMEACDTAK